MNTQPQELSISEHAQKLGVLATQLGYQGALTVGALEDEIRFYQHYQEGFVSPCKIEAR